MYGKEKFSVHQLSYSSTSNNYSSQIDVCNTMTPNRRLDQHGSQQMYVAL